MQVLDRERNATEIIDRLTEHKALGSAPREELVWLASHVSFRRMAAGEVLTAKGARVEGMFVVLSGRIAIFVDHGAGPHMLMEWRGGDVTGLLPYSRLVGPPADTVAQEPTEILVLPRDDLRAMTHECDEITAILVHSMVDRARTFNASGLQDEKMVSLGKLSAGLAHELNNPASAIERSAALLGSRLEEAERAARSLGAARLTDSQLAVLDEVRTACAATRAMGVRSPIEQAEREDAMADWLAAHGLDTAISDVLADTAATTEGLDRLAGTVGASALDSTLRWAAAGCMVRKLASEIQEAAARISALVTAIKGFTHMDQAVVAAPVDLIQGLSDTVAVLKAKARAKSATVTVQVEPELPRVLGFAAELNQVWANLIDNALDALPDSGRVEIVARREDRSVAVRVTDNGSGIPAEIRARIFDPFFTTKGVGQGTGLGLDITRRLVRHSGGKISVESEPGRTEFLVLLPIFKPAGTREAS